MLFLWYKVGTGISIKRFIMSVCIVKCMGNDENKITIMNDMKVDRVFNTKKELRFHLLHHI